MGECGDRIDFLLFSVAFFVVSLCFPVDLQFMIFFPSLLIYHHICISVAHAYFLCCFLLSDSSLRNYYLLVRSLPVSFRRSDLPSTFRQSPSYLQPLPSSLCICMFHHSSICTPTHPPSIHSIAIIAITSITAYLPKRRFLQRATYPVCRVRRYVLCCDRETCEVQCTLCSNVHGVQRGRDVRRIYLAMTDIYKHYIVLNSI